VIASVSSGRCPCGPPWGGQPPCLFGVTWLAVDAHLGAGAALHDGFGPFIIGHSIKAAIAAALLPAARKLADRRPGRPDSRAAR
jgi:biotin transporter BioY